jgi:hypothetical protein
MKLLFKVLVATIFIFFVLAVLDPLKAAYLFNTIASIIYIAVSTTLTQMLLLALELRALVWN